MPLAVLKPRNDGSFYGASTALIPGTVGAQNLASIENPAASGKTVFVQRAMIMNTIDSTMSVQFLVKFGRTTATPTAGTTQTAQKSSTGDASPVAIVRQGPTATAATGSLWVGNTGTQVANAAFPGIALEMIRPGREIELTPGEGLLVSADGNDVDNDFSVVFEWREK